MDEEDTIEFEEESVVSDHCLCIIKPWPGAYRVAVIVLLGPLTVYHNLLVTDKCQRWEANASGREQD